MLLRAPRIGAEAYRLIRCPDDALDDLCALASELRDRGRGRRVSLSPKVFIPLTRLCRDVCGYCSFRQDPAGAERLYMTPEEVLAVAEAGERLGCTEALFTLGERPEQRTRRRGRGWPGEETAPPSTTSGTCARWSWTRPRCCLMSIPAP